MRNKKSAFSLIEISIVVLIIGILIAGVTQSSRLIANSKLTTAQTLTQSSPVTANKGLMLWLETSSEDSIAASESSDLAAVTVWKDINPQTSTKLFANTIVASSVTYKAVSPIGGLPSLRFNTLDTSTGMEVASVTGSQASDVTIQGDATAFSFFVVSSDESTADAARSIIQNGATNTGWGYANTTTASTRAVLVGSSTNNLSTTNYSKNPEIISVTYDGTNLKAYRNGASVFTPAAATAVTPATTMWIGGNTTQTAATSWKGYISEVIVYNNALKDDDRKAIEQYLSKKYTIKITY